MKKILLVSFLFLSCFVLFPQPSFAAESPTVVQKIQSIFQNATQRVSNISQRLYLSLIPGEKPGSLVMNQAAQAMTQLQTAQVNTDISVDLQNNNQSQANFKVHADGPVKLTAPTDPQQYQQDLHITGAFSVQGTTMQADANLKMTNQKIYLQLNQVPVLPYINLADLKGRWLSADIPASTTPMTWTETQKEQLQQAYADLLKKSQFSSAQKATKDDHAVYVLDVTVPKAALLDYVEQVQKIQAQNQTDQNSGNTQMVSSRETMSQMLESFSEVKATLWVDRSTFFIRHIELPLVYTKPVGQVNTMVADTSPLASLAQFQSLHIAVVMNLDKFNQPVAFEAPANAEDAQQVLQNLMGTSLTGSKSAKPVVPTELPTLTPQQQKMLEQYKGKLPSGY